METEIRRGFVLGSLLLSVQLASAQTWTLTSAPTNNYWDSIVSSADGSKLAVSGGGPVFQAVYTSTNSGATWISNAQPDGPYLSSQSSILATSADGTQLITAVNHNGWISTSTNWGLSWVSRTNFGDIFWSSAASSADGRIQVLSERNGIGHICISTNSGVTWNVSPLPYLGSFPPYAALSANGDFLVVAEDGGGIYSTTNFGGSWVTNSLSVYWQGIASSVDGMKLVLVAQTGQIYTSTNSGAAWVQQTNAPALPWTSVASSADGTKLVAVSGGSIGSTGPIFTSTDSGITWVSNDAPNLMWVSVASSVDGSKLFATSFTNGIWTAQVTPTPRLNAVPSTTNLLLSWIVPSTNFVVQQSADLSGWTDITNTPILNLTNLEEEVTLPVTSGSGFYRLATP